MVTNNDGPLNGLRIGIVGGSIAGCTVAVELLRLGVDVTIFERSGEELKDRGAGIGVPAAVVDTFIERDLVDHTIPRLLNKSFLRICRTSEQPRYGYLAWDQPAEISALNWGGLYQNLRQRVPADCYKTHRQVIAIDPSLADQASLTFADGREDTFDIIVCADGYNSIGRRALFPDVEFAYAGYVLWRGCIDESTLDESPPLEHGIHCVGYTNGHGIFYFVPGTSGSTAPGRRLVNWGLYLPVDATQIESFMTDSSGQQHQGSLPPGSMPLDTEKTLKARARELLPEYYAQITDQSPGTFAYAIYDCEVPAYRKNRVCLAGDAGAFSRPHSGAGAKKSMDDAIALSSALAVSDTVEDALTRWNKDRTDTNNALVRFGNQLGRALVEEIPDWSHMDEAEMETWFTSIVTIQSDHIRTKR